jgi:type IV fimbrial biogenesis protein FimT
VLGEKEALDMLMRRHSRSRGFTIVELLVTITVLGIVLMLGLPNMSAWLQNTQIRTSAEAMVSGLQLARTEALRRNRQVRFNVVDTLDAGCNLIATGGSWVVSMADPSGKCNVDPSDTTDPFIVQRRSGQDGSQNVAVSATASTVLFNGLGSAGAPVQFAVTNPNGGTCQQSGGTMRCLQINVSASGSVRMCDPAVGDATDPRKCP